MLARRKEEWTQTLIADCDRYCPGRQIQGRGWPRTVQLDAETMGTLFFDLTAAPDQEAGPAVWFQRTKIAAMLG